MRRSTAFTHKAFGGNSAAVVLLEPRHLPLADAARQAIAVEMNLSETAFLEAVPADGQSVADGAFAAAHACAQHCFHGRCSAIMPMQGLATDTSDILVRCHDNVFDIQPHCWTVPCSLEMTQRLRIVHSCASHDEHSPVRRRRLQAVQPVRAALVHACQGGAAVRARDAGVRRRPVDWRGQRRRHPALRHGRFRTPFVP